MTEKHPDAEADRQVADPRPAFVPLGEVRTLTNRDSNGQDPDGGSIDLSNKKNHLSE